MKKGEGQRKAISCYEDQSLGNTSRSFQDQIGLGWEESPVCGNGPIPVEEVLRVLFSFVSLGHAVFEQTCARFFFFKMNLQNSAWKTRSLPLALCTCLQHSTSNTIVLGMPESVFSCRWYLWLRQLCFPRLSAVLAQGGTSVNIV